MSFELGFGIVTYLVIVTLSIVGYKDLSYNKNRQSMIFAIIWVYVLMLDKSVLCYTIYYTFYVFILDLLLFWAF